MLDQGQQESQPTKAIEVRDVVRQALEEFVRGEHQKSEPAYKAELEDERRRRESLEVRLNQLVEENRKTRAQAEEADRSSQIRSELQKLGVAKVDLAFRAVKDDIVRSDGDNSMQDYLAKFVQENPELLPARIAGGSGAQSASKPAGGVSSVDLNSIRPGMSKDELDQVRQEISRLASQAMRGL
jgi:hypothetical protein